MSRIIRQMYRAQCRAGQAAVCAARFRANSSAPRSMVSAGRLLTCSAFHWGEHFFFYYEALDQPAAPEELFLGAADLLLPWPGSERERAFVPLTDIFHCVEPVNRAHWQRKRAPERIHAQVARLKPEMASSYIFYHYQLQEEKPGGFDKYCLIGMHEDWLFFYLEKPFVVEPPPFPGKLHTHNSPPNWQEVMNPHFVYWQDTPPGQHIWREIDPVFTIPELVGQSLGGNT